MREKGEYLRLIASDLDGTLLTGEKEITELTEAVLARTASAGILFVPATGRAFASLPESVLRLPGVEYVITSNGAAIYSASKRARIYSRLMEASSVDEILALPDSPGVAMEGFIDGIPYSDARYVASPERFGASEHSAAYVRRTRKPVEDIRGFLRKYRDKMDSIAFVSADMEQLRRQRHLAQQRVSCISLTSSMPQLLEICHMEADKGKTLLYLLRLLNISVDRAAAFGDAYNDIDMIRSVKYGVAVANAVDACRDAALFVTDSNEADGVAHALLRILNGECG